MYRQGDILIVPHAGPVEGREIAPIGGRHVLAEGEATGHHHSVPATGRVRFFRPDDIPAGTGGVLVAHEPWRLEHQEHDAIAVPAGTWRVVRQREYRPEAIRFVAD